MIQMSIDELKRRKLALEVELAEEIDAKIKAFERHTGIAIASVEVDVGCYGDFKPFYEVTRVATKLDI